MSAVVIAVVIFLFGVSVGRDVRGMAPQNAAATPAAPAATDTAVPTEPPAAQATPNDLSYPQALEGRAGTDPAKVAPPTPASEPPPDAPPASTVASPKPESATPARPQAPASRPDAKPVAAADEFFLQVTSLSSEPAASSLVSILKGKGYPASLVTMPENTPVRFRVHVGPYHSRAEAQRVQSRLEKEGYKPLIKR